MSATWNSHLKFTFLLLIDFFLKKDCFLLLHSNSFSPRSLYFFLSLYLFFFLSLSVCVSQSFSFVFWNLTCNIECQDRQIGQETNILGRDKKKGRWEKKRQAGKENGIFGKGGIKMAGSEHFFFGIIFVRDSGCHSQKLDDIVNYNLFIKVNNAKRDLSEFR